jgi:hypothetical protein
MPGRGFVIPFTIPPTETPAYYKMDALIKTVLIYV